MEGPGIDTWRREAGVFIPGAECSKLFNTRIDKDKPLGPGNRRWDGMKYPGVRDQATGTWTFGRGLLGRVLSAFHASIEQPPISTPPIIPPTIEGFRDYQQEALNLVFSKRWGRIALPTNSGKGAVIALSAVTLARAGHRVIVLCDELAVFGALDQEIAKWGGVVPDKVTEDPNEDPPTGSIVLAMLPTVYSRTRRVTRRKNELLENLAVREGRVVKWRSWVQNFTAVLVDEADKATNDSYQSVLHRLCNTHFRIGFSGTFIHAEDSPEELILSEQFGDVHLRMRNLDMVERGISAKPFVELVSFEQHIVRPPREEWNAMKPAAHRQFVYEQGVVRNAERHRLVIDLLDPSEPNAIVVNYIEHGRNLAQVIPNSQFLFGGDNKEVRESVLSDFRKGKFQNLVVTRILDRGTNELGLVVGLIFASSQGSPRQTLQRIGRGLRRAGGKEFLFLKDILDRGFSYFNDASIKRVELYNEEGFEVSIRV